MATLRQKVIIVEAFRALKNGLLESQDSNHRDIEQSGYFLLLCIILSKPPYSCPFPRSTSGSQRLGHASKSLVVTLFYPLRRSSCLPDPKWKRQSLYVSERMRKASKSA